MTWSVSAGLLLGLLQASAAPASDSMGVDPLLESRVAARIAQEWSVPPESIHLQWSDPAGASASPVADIRVVGRGSEGWFAVAVDPTGAGATALRVRAGVNDTVFVAARPLSLGSRLREGDLRKEVRLRWGPPRSRTAETAAPGWEIRRPLGAGDVVAWPAAIAPSVIAAGESVRLEWTRGLVRISVEGAALHAARLGEMVRVRVAGRRDPMTGQVTSPGTAVLCVGGAR
jgi:flagella basal body P-ring formation protein FlgA